MIQVEESITNPIYRGETDYCRFLFRERHLSPLAMSQASDETSMAGYLEIYNFAIAEEEVCAVLCANLDIPFEGKGSIAVKDWRDIEPNLWNLRSSREYSMARTSPIIDKLSQIWVHSAIGFELPIDMNRVHRNLFFDITSSDPVEDFIRIESSGAPFETPRPQIGIFPQPSREIIQFCLRYGILQYLSVAIDLIGQSFSSIGKLNVYPEQDPETGEEWLTLDLTLQGEIDDVLNSYDTYTDRWISTVPWPQRNKIRLSYNIL